MAAEFEEIVFDADALQPQNLREDAAQRLFRSVARGDIPPRKPRVEIGRRQRLAVDLAVRRQRQRLENHERRRDHIVGKVARNSRAQCGGVGLSALVARHISHQPLLAGDVLARQNEGLPNLRQPRQPRLDLAKLDAEAADLHLMIDAAQELDVSVGPKRARSPVR